MSGFGAPSQLCDTGPEEAARAEDRAQPRCFSIAMCSMPASMNTRPMGW
jgi:hypothetical protein